MLRHLSTFFFRTHLAGTLCGLLAMAAVAAAWAHETPSVSLSALDCETHRIELTQRPDGPLTLTIDAHQELKLAAQGARLGAPLALLARCKNPASGATQCALSFSMATAADSLDTCVWLREAGGTWQVCGEWTVARYNHEERGEKKESQTLEFTPGGILHHTVKRENIEGIKTSCGQACQCTIWQSKTIYCDEDEMLEWRDVDRKSVNVSYRKWYLCQPEENVMSIARKLELANFTALYYLNPGLQRLEKLPDGYKLLVEKR